MKTNVKSTKSLKTFESNINKSQKLSTAKKRMVQGGDFSFDTYTK